MRNILMFSALAAVASAANASSPDAWNDLYRTTSQSCLNKSGLKNARVIEGPVTFSHAVLYKIRGVWPQPHMKGKTGKVYCVHPYPDGAPEIGEAR